MGTVTIRNGNTRLPYGRACYQFFHCCQQNELPLDTVRPFHVAVYIQQMPSSKPTMKEKLAAIRMLYDFLVRVTAPTGSPRGDLTLSKVTANGPRFLSWSLRYVEEVARDSLTAENTRYYLDGGAFIFALRGGVRANDSNAVKGSLPRS